jgi:hypothetical protein
MKKSQLRQIIKEEIKNSLKEEFEVGDMWTEDFDYEGMLGAGLKAQWYSDIGHLKALYASFEDVNFHKENEYLGKVIDALTVDEEIEAEIQMDNFHNEINKTLNP